MGWLIALAVIVLVAICPVGVCAKYNENGPLVKLQVGFLKFLVIPSSKKEKKEKKEKKVKKGTEVQVQSAAKSAASAPDLSSLTPRQQELYAMLPQGPFTADALTAKGVPISEAASTLTLMEIYGLVASRPGGMFELK